MTIESLANDCFKRSGYAINKQDLISRIEFLCEQYHQSKVNNVVLDDFSQQRELLVDFWMNLPHTNKNKNVAKHFVDKDLEAKKRFFEIEKRASKSISELKVNNVVSDDVSKREIIKKYKKDRNIQANYKLDEDEMYLIELHLFSVKSSVIIEKERQRIWTELCKEVDEDRLTDDFVGSSDDVYDVIFNGKELE